MNLKLFTVKKRKTYNIGNTTNSDTYLKRKRKRVKTKGYRKQVYIKINVIEVKKRKI